MGGAGSQGGLHPVQCSAAPADPPPSRRGKVSQVLLKSESNPLRNHCGHSDRSRRTCGLFVSVFLLTPHPSAQMCGAVRGRALGWRGGGSGCMRHPRTLGKAWKGKAPYLPSSSYSWYSSVKRVQVVVAMMGFVVFFFPPRTVVGVRNARCVAADGRTSGHSLRPPPNLRTVQLLAGARTSTLTHTRTRSQTRSRARNNAQGSADGGLVCGEDGLFKYHTGWRCELTAWRASTD